MLKKLERRIKEKLERLSDKDIGSIKDLISFIKVAYELCHMACFTVLLGIGVFLIFIMVETGYTRVTTVIIPIVSLAILCIINAYAKKVDKICDEVILDRNTNPEIKRLKDNLSNEEYTQVICIDEKWHENMDDFIQDIKEFEAAFEKQTIRHYAKINPDNSVDIIFKTSEGESLGVGLTFSKEMFLEIYKIQV